MRITPHLLHVYLHREPHSSGPFDMQLVYEDMQTDKRYGDEYGCEYGTQVCIYTDLLALRDQSINKSKKHLK